MGGKQADHKYVRKGRKMKVLYRLLIVEAWCITSHAYADEKFRVRELGEKLKK